jgi:hypothetical protein
VAYSGDTNNLSSTGTLTKTFAIAQQSAPTLTAPTYTPSTANTPYGTSEVLSTSSNVALGGASASEVSFKYGSTVIPCGSPVAQTAGAKTTFSCTANYVPISVAITAIYGGTTNIASSSASPSTTTSGIVKANPVMTGVAPVKSSSPQWTYTIAIRISPFSSTFDTAEKVTIKGGATGTSTIGPTCSNLSPDPTGLVSCVVTFNGSSGVQKINGAIVGSSPNLSSAISQVNVQTFTPVA